MTRLGRLEFKPCLGFLETALDVELGTFKIDVRPAKRQQLPAPHASAERHRYDRIERISCKLAQDLGHFTGGQ
jgi:hypothetical protein